MQRFCSACSCLSRARTSVPSGSNRAYGVIPNISQPRARAEERPVEPKPSVRSRRSRYKDCDGGSDTPVDVRRGTYDGSRRSVSRDKKNEASRLEQSSEHQEGRGGNEKRHAVLRLQSDQLSSSSASPTSNHQSAQTPKSGKIHFKGLHHDTAIPAFHRPSSPSHPIIKFKSPYMHIRAMPTSFIPSSPPSPFPKEKEVETHKDRHPDRREIGFGVVASKNAVSAMASERGRCRKRFKSAVENVVNGPGTCAERIKGQLRSDWSYLAVLSREIYEVPMDTLCKSLVEGFDFINMQQERGIGIGSGSRTGGVRQDRYSPRSRNGTYSSRRDRVV